MQLYRARKLTPKELNASYKEARKLVRYDGGKPVEEFNPHGPFWGPNGKTYRLAIDEKYNEFMNCYALAMGWLTFGNPAYDFFPGGLAKLETADIPMEEKIIADLKAVDRKCLNIVHAIPEHLPKAPENAYWIIAMHCKYSDKYDWHFKRQDRNTGVWFHKLGWERAPEVVADNEVISKQEQAFSSFQTYDEIKAMILLADSSRHDRYVVTKSRLSMQDNACYANVDANGTRYIFEPQFAMLMTER